MKYVTYFGKSNNTRDYCNDNKGFPLDNKKGVNIFKVRKTKTEICYYYYFIVSTSPLLMHA